MAKVITTLTAESGLEYHMICSFKTESHIGLWDGSSNQYVLFDADDTFLNMVQLGNPESLKALDDKVYEHVEEHIEEVFAQANYQISLLAKE